MKTIGLALSLTLAACSCPSPFGPPGPTHRDAGSLITQDARPQDARPAVDAVAIDPVCALPPCGQAAAAWIAWGQLCVAPSTCRNVTCPHDEAPRSVCGIGSTLPGGPARPE